MAALGTSCGHLLVGDALARYGVNQAVQPFKSVALDVSFVQPERELLNVAVKVLRAGRMVHADDSAFQDRPDCLNRVSVNDPLRVLTSAVIDAIGAEEKPIQIGVGWGFVRVDRRAHFNLLVDLLLNRMQGAIRNYFGACAPAALPHAEYGGLTDSAAPRIEFLMLVLVRFLATKERFVDFDDAFQLVDVIRRTASLSQALQHEPRGVLADPYLLGKLKAADALACGHQQVHGVDPLMQRDMRPSEDRTCAHGEIEVTGVATEETFLPGSNALGSAARWALRTIRPKAILKILAGRFFVREKLEKLEGADCGFRQLLYPVYLWHSKPKFLHHEPLRFWALPSLVRSEGSLPPEVSRQRHRLDSRSCNTLIIALATV